MLMSNDCPTCCHLVLLPSATQLQILSPKRAVYLLVFRLQPIKCESLQRKYGSLPSDRRC